ASDRAEYQGRSRRGCAGAGQEDQGTDIINHREIRPDCATLLYSGVGRFDPHCKEGRNPFRTLVFSRKPSRSSLSDVDIPAREASITVRWLRISVSANGS